jgi:hypothetical protein
LDSHGAAGLRGKTLNHRQSEAGTAADFLGGEKRVESSGECQPASCWRRFTEGCDTPDLIACSVGLIT